MDFKFQNWTGTPLRQSVSRDRKTWLVITRYVLWSQDMSYDHQECLVVARHVFTRHALWSRDMSRLLRLSRRMLGAPEPQSIACNFYINITFWDKMFRDIDTSRLPLIYRKKWVVVTEPIWQVPSGLAYIRRFEDENLETLSKFSINFFQCWRLESGLWGPSPT